MLDWVNFGNDKLTFIRELMGQLLVLMLGFLS